MLHNTVVILGAGESGVGAALLAQKLGYAVFVSDLGIIGEQYLKVLQSANIPFEQERHSEQKILNIARFAIKSPGIPDKAPLIVALREKGIEVIDEIEFAYRHRPASAQVIAITGSNGKTTTTRLIHHILEASGKNAALVGNVGYSFARHLAEQAAANYYVVEASSFQLDGCTSFKPDIALLLNITPDHLDRYEYDYRKYIASKFRICAHQSAQQLFIYGSDSEGVQIGLNSYFSSAVETMPISMEDCQRYIPVATADLQRLPLKGRHNLFNMAVAAQAARRLGLSDTEIAAALATFQNEAHRLQYVATIYGVEYINDSKATNVDSVFYALDAMTRPVVWIVGGIDKGNDYSQILPLVQQKVKAIVCLGKDNSPIRQAFGEVQPIIEETVSMGEAIKVASLYAESGDTVLLSPACASFDLFQNYKDRGEQFMRIVRESLRLITEGERITLHLNIDMGSGEQA